MVFSAFELSTIFMMTFPPLSMLHRSDHEASGVFWGRSGNWTNKEKDGSEQKEEGKEDHKQGKVVSKLLTRHIPSLLPSLLAPPLFAHSIFLLVGPIAALGGFFLGEEEKGGRGGEMPS